jgi:hypothetical protein
VTETEHPPYEPSAAAGAAAPSEGDYSTFRRFAPMRLNLLTGTLTPVEENATPMDDVSEISDTAPDRGGDSAPLRALTNLTKMVRGQRQEVESRLRTAKAKLEALRTRQRRHNKQLLRPFSAPPPELESQIGLMRTEVSALEAWREASVIHLTFEPAEMVDSTYREIMRAFDSLRASWAKWDVSGEIAASGLSERPSSSDYPPASLEFRDGYAVAFNGKALKFEAADKSAVIIYPAMVMTVGPDGARDLFDLRELQVSATQVHHAEDGIVPPDTRLLRNPPGDLSRRRADASLLHDHRLPICVYGRLALRGPGGLLREYQFSNAVAAENFAEAFGRFRREVYGDEDLSD